ncbi:GNAT family N-acetyltransferase [Thioclava atlantica]|uniref:Putative acetyltransferase, GNAT family protein n=1 Tax=Thioclava atlantica TaxID=1317124 RepID=A0A085U140_9RHOB|nr:GNAT family N-acetyltransferase [Thioclava atlantica]KFE36687.1 putative acetyltransferase, GNAT family protein [Thioclava atlantica]
MIEIRQATDADADEAVSTLRRSIIELCVADHLKDPSEIEDWLGNKTVETWHHWIARADAVVLVAERDGKIIGVGMTTLSGNILLNYVHPDARFNGVSKAILSGLEDVLRAREIRRCRLVSTVTARSFYESCGFQSEGSDALLLSKSL